MGTPRQLARRKSARGCEPTSEKLSSQLFLLFPTRLSVTDGDTTRTFTYHADGQLARANYGGKSEEFLWDGLALIHRGGEQFINEPHVGNAPKKLRFEGKPRAQRSARRARKGPRGNPVVSSKGVSYFNDMLGTTVGFKSNGKYSAAALSAFGEDISDPSSRSPFPVPSSPFFTGKPYVEGLGHTFLMRNYRADLAKWQTADPMGYPDGWNQLAYCNNGVVEAIDFSGTFVTAVYSISQKKLTVTDDDSHVMVIVSNVKSGDNMLSHQWLPDIGPLPLCQYTMLDHANPNWYELWRNDDKFDDYTVGPSGVKRGNFRLHPGTYSLGCITLPSGDVNTKAALDLILKTTTETIHPASNWFRQKIKYGVLTVEE